MYLPVPGRVDPNLDPKLVSINSAIYDPFHVRIQQMPTRPLP